MNFLLMDFSLDDFKGLRDVDLPQTVTAYGSDPGGLILLLNSILKLSIFISLLFAVINLLISGIQYIGSSGNPEVIKQASSRIWISILGVTVTATALLLAALFGYLLFGSATAIIQPTIYGPTQ